MQQPADRDRFEQEVCALMRSGDQRFVELLYDRYGEALYGLALRIVRDEALASDVVQDSFVKVWKNHASFDSSRSRVFTWMYSLVRNTAIDKLRSVQKRANREIQTDDQIVSPTTDQVIRPDSIDIPLHVSSLDEKHQEVINALFFRGLTQQEASDELGLPLGTVKTRLRIALRELRKIYVDDSG